jgi:predicted metal-binding protein
MGQKSDYKLTSLLADCRAKWSCFKCGDKWGKGHTCLAQVHLHIVQEVLSDVRQFGSVVLVQTEESDSDEGLELLAMQKEQDHSATTVKKPTMRLLGWVGKQQALILVDLGSAATFISTTFADKCGLHMDQFECS